MQCQLLYCSVLVLDTMSTHEPVPALSSIAVDPSPYSSLQYTYHSQPLHDILYNEPMFPSYPNVESYTSLRDHTHTITSTAESPSVAPPPPPASSTCSLIVKYLKELPPQSIPTHATAPYYFRSQHPNTNRALIHSSRGRWKRIPTCQSSILIAWMDDQDARFVFGCCDLK